MMNSMFIAWISLSYMEYYRILVIDGNLEYVHLVSFAHFSKGEYLI